MNINIEAFPIHKVKKNSTVVIIGKRNTGKSFLIKDILYHMREIPMGIVVSHTDKLQHYYDKFIPRMFIYDEYSSATLEKLFTRQKKAQEEGWRDPYAFVLFDDCLSDKQWVKDKLIKEIFYNGRWYKIFFILAMQSPTGLPPSFRTNIDYTFILKNNITSDRERIFKNYAGMFPDRETFERVVDKCTEDYHCLVIDNTTQSNKLEDQVFIYKAKNYEDFKMCSDNIWRVSNEQYQGANQYNNTRTNEIKTKAGYKITIKKK